mgnify:CR=1 FL=1
MNYLKYLMAFFLCAPFLSNLQAQDTNAEWNRSDSLAIQFSVNDIIEVDVSPFQAGGISFKKLLPDDRSFRVGIQLKGDHDFNNKDQDKFTTNIDTTNIESDNNEGFWRLRVNSQFLHEYTVSEQERINLYYGIGPALRVGYNENNRTSNRIYSDYQVGRDTPWKIQKKNINQTWELGAGVSTAIGMEWFFTENFSLMLEYAPKMIVRYQNTVREEIHKTKYDPESEWDKDNEWETTTNNWSVYLSSSNTRFGISLYF